MTDKTLLKSHCTLLPFVQDDLTSFANVNLENVFRMSFDQINIKKKTCLRNCIQPHSTETEINF